MFCAVKVPSLPVTRSTSAFVPLFLTLTEAPGIARPSESTTVPDKREKKLPCAYAGDPMLNASIRLKKSEPSPNLEPLIITLLQVTPETTDSRDGMYAGRAGWSIRNCPEKDFLAQKTH